MPLVEEFVIDGEWGNRDATVAGNESPSCWIRGDYLRSGVMWVSRRSEIEAIGTFVTVSIKGKIVGCSGNSIKVEPGKLSGWLAREEIESDDFGVADCCFFRAPFGIRYVESKSFPAMGGFFGSSGEWFTGFQTHRG